MAGNDEKKMIAYEAQINMGNLKEVLIEVRESTGMNRKAFAQYFSIPYRTMQDWELGNRQMPEYLLRLIMYKVKMEGLLKGDKE